MKAEYVNPFITAATNVLKTMAQTNPVPGKPELKKGKATWGCVTGVIGMAGPSVSGNMVLSFDKESILEIVSKMLMETFPEISDDVMDAVGEITNMITGGAKKEFSDMGLSFEMATPIMVKGQGVEIQQLANTPTLVIPFKTEKGTFVIEANLGDRKS